MSIMGTVVNGYKFLKVIGSGQFGAVYEVEKNNVHYAAKVYHDHILLREYRGNDNRIKREVDILKKVDSDYLIKYYDDFKFNNQVGVKEYCVIMELCVGDNLTNFLEKNKLSFDEKIILFKGILKGVGDLHKEGILHRDIKPDNIVVEKNGKIKIIDYGLAKLIDFTSITSTGTQIGSPLFMAPEQFKDSKNIDERADIYALGVVLYNILTNEYPYEATTIEELLNKIYSEPIIPPTKYNADIPNKFEKIIYKLLSKKKHQRYQSTDKVLEDINNDTIESLIYNNEFYPWCLKEKTVIEKYLIDNKDVKVIFPIHMKFSQKGLFNMICNGKLKAIIDPSTHRLSYDTFGDVSGLKKLKYAPLDGIVKLNDLKDLSFRKSYISDWYDEIKGFNEIIFPYPYISNSSYKKEDLAKWIQSAIQLINEANDFLCNHNDFNKVRYAMIALDINHLVYEKDLILSYYSSIEVDGIFFQVSGLKTINSLKLRVYIDFLRELQLTTNNRVIVLKVPVPLGLYVLSCGIHGFSCGISSLEYFDEEFISKERQAYNIYAKYYFPELLTLISYARKEPYQLSSAYNILDKCSCPYCNGREFVDIAAEKDLTISLHFLYSMHKEIKMLNSIVDSEEKLKYYEQRIKTAIEIFQKLEIEKDFKQKDQYDLLKIINETIQKR